MPMYGIFVNGKNQGSFRDVVLAYMEIRVSDPSDRAKTAALVADLQATSTPHYCPYTDVTEGPNDENKTIDKISLILNQIFNIIIGITMFLCFFALSSNMSANLYEQKKEVAMLRSMGYTKCRVRCLYFYEALILVFASCILGVGIGMLVGYTMFLQQALITGVKVPFFFPTQQFLLIFSLSIICAFLSTMGSTSALIRKPIAVIFRS